tara:strand:- start:147 stop:395 length:249 start_codon:yes stop_codon:yes gene_type:complete
VQECIPLPKKQKTAKAALQVGTSCNPSNHAAKNVVSIRLDLKLVGAKHAYPVQELSQENQQNVLGAIQVKEFWICPLKIQIG